MSVLVLCSSAAAEAQEAAAPSLRASRISTPTRERVYDLDLVNTRTTFQFTKQFFLRAIAQYDSLRARVLTDFLASYELRPGTVAYAGYGSLYEQRAFGNDGWIPLAGDYLTIRRGFFMKASYLYRF